MGLRAFTNLLLLAIVDLAAFIFIGLDDEFLIK